MNETNDEEDMKMKREKQALRTLATWQGKRLKKKGRWREKTTMRGNWKKRMWFCDIKKENKK